MALKTRLQDAARTLLGISAYAPQEPLIQGPPEELQEQLRSALGGQIQPLLPTRTRWYLADLEDATRLADSGDLARVGQLCRSMRRDGMISGLMGTRTSGLVSLPKRWRGNADVIADLTNENGSRTVFDEIFPPSELALLAADGIGPGVGIAELVPVPGRKHPVMIRLEPEFLSYRWNESRWYYRSVVGTLPITPGDGRWILHTPGGRLNPWTSGQWAALGRAFINKEHALLHRSNFSAKLANPARVAYAPPGADDDQREGFLARLMAWGLNTCFQMPAGWDVKLVESNGRGWDVFGKEIETSDLEIMIALAGQVVTVTGGTGFANADIHQTIRSDLIKQTGDTLAYTLNTQGIPPYVYHKWGADMLAESARVAWDTDPPADRKTSAEAISAAGKAIKEANEALRPYNVRLDATELSHKFGLPIVEITKHEESKTLELTDDANSKTVTVREAREAQGLEPLGDERDDLTIQELEDSADVEKAEIGAQEPPAQQQAPQAPAVKPEARMRSKLTALSSGVLKASE